MWKCKRGKERADKTSLSTFQGLFVASLPAALAGPAGGEALQIKTTSTLSAIKVGQKSGSSKSGED